MGIPSAEPTEGGGCAWVLETPCDAIATEIKNLYNVEVKTAQVDADSVPATAGPAAGRRR